MWKGEVVSELLLDWPSPAVIERRRRRRLVVTSLVVVVVTLIASTALVHGFDVVSGNASVAQLASQGYPTYAVGCVDCDSGFRLPLPDWRSLSVWGLAMVAAVAGWTVRRR